MRASVAEQAVAERFAARLLAGMHAAPELAERLGFAGTTASLRVAGGEEGVTLLLDRQPPEVRARPEPAEVVVELSAADLDALVGGEAFLPLLLVAGRGSHEGPVRRLLGVWPILRSLLARGAEAR